MTTPGIPNPGTTRADALNAGAAAAARATDALSKARSSDNTYEAQNHATIGLAEATLARYYAAIAALR